MPKYVFVTGGVTSSLGKGITAASIGRILKARGVPVSNLKVGRYLNVGPGPGSPCVDGVGYGHEVAGRADLDVVRHAPVVAENATQAGNVSTGRTHEGVLATDEPVDSRGGALQV